MGHLIGIIFNKNNVIAVEIVIGITLFLIMFCNLFLPIKEMTKFFQILSNISYLKFSFNSLLIIFYGFSRCSTDKSSLVLDKFDLKDELIFTYAENLLIYCISLRILAFIILYIKTNTFFKRTQPKEIIRTHPHIFLKKDESTQNCINKRNFRKNSAINKRKNSVTNLKYEGKVDDEDESDAESEEVRNRKISVKTNSNIFLKKDESAKNYPKQRNFIQTAKAIKRRKNSVINLKFEGNVDDENEDESDAKPEEVSDKKISIAWIDLTLRNTEKTFSKEKIIFKQLNGSFDFGSLNALMGPLGAGKTSLLRCLNGRYRNQMSDETKIYLSKFEKIRTCFISQDVSEHLLKGLTVKQAMIFASKLKNSDQEVNHEENVNVLINNLLISNVKDTYIENCSAGEQKRLVIAMEMTSYLKPNLVCIDEPTSGLETDAAEVVIRCLKALSRMHNISIITSILQPNSDVLMMFDKLFVLSKGGVCVYSGSPKDMKNHLNECQIFCTECQKPIEVIMKIACKEPDDNHVIKLSQKVSEEKETLLMRCFNETQLSLDGIQLRSRRFKFIDFWYLLLRTTTYTYKYYWELISGQFVVLVSIGFLLKYFFNPKIGKPNGCISFEDFNNTCDKTEDQISEDILLTQNITYNFLVVTFIMFLMLVTTTMTFPTKVRVFQLEHRNGVFEFH